MLFLLISFSLLIFLFSLACYLIMIRCEIFLAKFGGSMNLLPPPLCYTAHASSHPLSHLSKQSKWLLNASYYLPAALQQVDSWPCPRTVSHRLAGWFFSDAVYLCRASLRAKALSFSHALSSHSDSLSFFSSLVCELFVSLTLNIDSLSQKLSSF